MIGSPRRKRVYSAPAPDASSSARRFESVFRPDGMSMDGSPRYRIAGSGVRRWPTDATATRSVVELLNRRGIETKQRSMGSPANADSYHVDAAFLDGGLHATTGNYWFGEKGAWIDGREAAAWVARGLGLAPPGALRRQRPPKLAEALLAAYRLTEFVVFQAGEIVIRVDQPAPTALVRLMLASKTATAIVVTAFNPFSVSLPEEVNQLRQQFLRQDIAERGLTAVEAEGRDPARQWPPEASLMVLGASAEQVTRLLVDYQQHAVVFSSLGEPTRLVLHPRQAARGKRTIAGR